MLSEFNFFKHWYPLSPIEDLDPNRPTAITLLGLHLVIWKPKSSQNYTVFLDRCPHRLAPLSEGRIDDKTDSLMCTYHGWQFDSQGNCIRIPQAENNDAIIKNQENFCVVAFPCREANDLLWVWADPDSAELADRTSLPLSPQIDASKGFVWSSFVRDLEYDWSTLVENVADPSHVAFAHHGIQGNRDKATPIPMKVLRSTGDAIEVETKGAFNTNITFEPPCRLEYAICFGDKEQQVGLITYCIPVSPGKCRIVAQFTRNFAKTFQRLIPRWWDHINNRNAILDGDMILLHQQERFLQQKQLTQSWKDAYNLPTSADRLVIEFRRWFDKYCNGQIPWSEEGIVTLNSANTSLNRQHILDRYSQHTQHCSSCREALKTINRLQIGLLAYFALAVAGVALMPDSIRLQWGLPIIILALLGLGVYSWLKFWLKPKFYFVDYIHADR
jgi:phenylpropionate dioxygenase-like ring-hydroxylating dioxygenase large terminal subunit